MNRRICVSLTALNGDILRVCNSGLAAIALTACFGIAGPAALAAGVDARVRCTFPVVLAKAVGAHARQEGKERGVKTMKEWPPDYRWCAVDLNNDGRLEVIYHSGFCGMGGCNSQVLAWRGAKLAPIGEMSISHDVPMIGKRRHRGWRDLYIRQKNTATSYSILVYTFRRGAYREVSIPLMFFELSDTRIDPDSVTINRDRNEFHIGQNVPEEEHAKRLRDNLGWNPLDWEGGGDPGYRDEAYKKEN